MNLKLFTSCLFGQIVAHVPELIKRLMEDNSPSSQECIRKVAELVYCLMYQHAGYPDLYEPILEVLKVLIVVVGNSALLGHFR